VFIIDGPCRCGLTITHEFVAASQLTTTMSVVWMLKRSSPVKPIVESTIVGPLRWSLKWTASRVSRARLFSKRTREN
tara:strand:- start:124 stop:354 length:231 start_codon:yes stop_codon:yes gene_type:complete